MENDPSLETFFNDVDISGSGDEMEMIQIVSGSGIELEGSGENGSGDVEEGNNAESGSGGLSTFDVETEKVSVN